MMKILLIGLGALTGLQAQHPDISPDRIRAHVKFLSSDLLEGRGPGTRGGELATEYIATQFALSGLKPAGDGGTFFQQVPLIGSRPNPRRSYRLPKALKRSNSNGKTNLWASTRN
jgi:hypothetical protein